MASRTLRRPVHPKTAALQALHCALCSTEPEHFSEVGERGEKVPRKRHRKRAWLAKSARSEPKGICKATRENRSEMAVIPSERVQIWVCLFLYSWSYPGVGLQICVFDLSHFARLKTGLCKFEWVWSSLINPPLPLARLERLVPAEGGRGGGSHPRHQTRPSPYSGTKEKRVLEGIFARISASLGCGALSATCTAGSSALGYFLFLGRDSGFCPPPSFAWTKCPKCPWLGWEKEGGRARAEHHESSSMAKRNLPKT